ncbi:Rieske (2Fe-2S) protein [Actinomadura hibisca]|uniref:Rieske (2Fe-2S) protein n=1 Tax=Actinomadura hibisca TaxID=68565 RepID=UPI000832CE2C|nr:Rieske (2Fe-2S) protein [Actinomadura hibisca]
MARESVEEALTGPAAGPDGRTRRGLLIGAGLAGVAGLAAACGGSDDAGGGDGGGDAGGDPSPTGGGDQGGGGGKAIAKTGDIPVGGGKVFKDEKVVVTQPAQGEFKAFSALCTHRRCPVGDVSGGTINCPCHGSKFKITDGSVANGPAETPLEPRTATVQGDQIMLA